MDITNVNEIKIDVLEYCTVAEKTPLPAETVKVYIPKLTVDTSKATVRANKSILVNDEECKPTIVNPIKLSDTIVVKTFSGLELSKSAVVKKSQCGCTVVNHELVKKCLGANNKFIDGHIVEAYLPKGAQMIVCFMNGNINDAYLTNFI